MKNTFHTSMIAGLAAILLNSCYNGQMMTSYENDDLYYNPGDTYITDYYDAQAASAEAVEENTQQTDDYYQENGATYSADQMTINNFNSPWYNPYYGGGFGGGPFFNNSMGFNSGWNAGVGMGWGAGWGMPSTYFSFNYNTFPFGGGYNWGYSPFMSPWNNWNSWNSWNNPWCSSFGFGSPFGYNPWNNYYYPFGGSFGGWGNNVFINNYYGDNGGFQMPVYGHRPNLSTGSTYNSTYTGGTLFNPQGRQQLTPAQPSETTRPNVNTTDRQPNTARETPKVETEKPRSNGGNFWNGFTTPNNSPRTGGGSAEPANPGRQGGNSGGSLSRPSGGSTGGGGNSGRTGGSGGSGGSGGGTGRTPRR